MWRSRWNWTNRTGTKCHSKSGCPCPCPVCWRHKLIGHMPNHWSMGSDPGSFVTISANQNNVVRDAIATSIDANCCWDGATMMKWSLDSIKARWHMETGIHYIVACTQINYISNCISNFIMFPSRFWPPVLYSYFPLDAACPLDSRPSCCPSWWITTPRRYPLM